MAWDAPITPQQQIQPSLKFLIPPGLLKLALKFLKRRHQGLRHIPSAINPKPPSRISRNDAGAPPLSRTLRRCGDFDFSSSRNRNHTLNNLCHSDRSRSEATAEWRNLL